MAFDDDLKALKLKHQSNLHSFDAACEFQTLYLKQARAIKASNPGEAARLIALAEDCQSTIGSFSTGSGEGLASMAELYDLMGERADILEGMGQLNEALALWIEVRSDPNGLWSRTPAAQKIQALQAKLKKP